MKSKMKSGRSANGFDVVERRSMVMQGVEEIERGECLELDEKGLKAFFRGVNSRGREC